MRVVQLDDPVLRDWYEQMVHDRELFQTWGADLSFDALLAGLENDTVIYAEEADGHPWFIAWVTSGPLSTGFLSCWTAKEYRQKKQAVAAFGLVLHCLFQVYALACCITIQDSVALMLTKLGFSYLGTVQPAGTHVLYYPRETFQQRQAEVANGRG